MSKLEQKTRTYAVRVYRAPRKLVRRLEAIGRLNDVLEEAARLLAWHGAARVTVRAPGGPRYRVLKPAPVAPGSPARALTDQDPPLYPTSDPPAPAGA